MSSSTSSSRAPHGEGRAASGCPAGSGPRARIDTSALVHNFGEVRRLAGPGTEVLAMVKSDAYGHGALRCASALAHAGCSAFGVTTVAEAAALSPVRTIPGAGPGRLVVFGGLLPEEAAAAVEAGAEVATQEIDVVRALGAAARAAGTEAAVHLKIDTGMHRLGLRPQDAADFARAASSVGGVRLVAACSHFALAESVTGEVTAGQLEAMLAASRAIEEAGFPLPRHHANSAAILTRPEAHLEMVRPGIMLYGVPPDEALRGIADLRPVMQLVARVVRVADVPEGDGVGYGHDWKAPRPSRVATLRLGYADGYPRALGNRGVAFLGGTRVPLVGRVCMDHVMLDVTDLPAVALGDEATLWGANPGVEEIAALADTIPYELLARVGSRVARIEADADGEPGRGAPDENTGKGKA